MLPKIITAKACSNFVLEVAFDGRTIKHFSFVPYLNYPVFKALQVQSFFETVAVKYGTVVWGENDEIDFDPYTIYLEGHTLQY